MADQGGAMWVYGKVHQGWYRAAEVWSDKLAKMWREQGYEVRQSDKNPGEVVA